MSWFQQLIGILWWTDELWRIDIQIEVLLLLQYQVLLWEGFLEALYLILHFLPKNPKKILVMDRSVPDVDKCVFNLNADWEEFYRDAVKVGPHWIPEPLGKLVYVGCFINADHGRNAITRCSHSGILLFVNNALMKSFRKFQTQSSKAHLNQNYLRWGMQRTWSWRSKSSGRANVFCDNNWAVNHTSITESNLSRKHNATNYHCVREEAASGILRIGKEETATNLANPLTNFLPYPQKQELLGCLIYDYWGVLGVVVSGRYIFG